MQLQCQCCIIIGTSQSLSVGFKSYSSGSWMVSWNADVKGKKNNKNKSCFYLSKKNVYIHSRISRKWHIYCKKWRNRCMYFKCLLPLVFQRSICFCLRRCKKYVVYVCKKLNIRWAAASYQSPLPCCCSSVCASTLCRTAVRVVT